MKIDYKINKDESNKIPGIINTKIKTSLKIIAIMNHQVLRILTQLQINNLDQSILLEINLAALREIVHITT